MTPDQRQQWLRDRQRGLMSTDTPRLFGVYFDGEYGPQNVYAEKLSPEPVNDAADERMQTGAYLEPYIGQRFTETTGIKLFKPEPITWCRERPWQGSSIDFGCESESGIVEAKAVFEYPDPTVWGESGTDKVPDRVALQATKAAGVAGVESAFVAALFVGHEFRVYQLPFDAELFRMITEVEESFWRRVVGRAGLDGWDHPLVGEVVNRVQGIKVDKVQPLTVEWQEAYDRSAELARIIREADEAKKELKDQMNAEIGDAEYGVMPDGRIVQRRLVEVKEHTRAASSYVKLAELSKKQRRAFEAALLRSMGRESISA